MLQWPKEERERERSLGFKGDPPSSPSFCIYVRRMVFFPTPLCPVRAANFQRAKKILSWRSVGRYGWSHGAPACVLVAAAEWEGKEKIKSLCFTPSKLYFAGKSLQGGKGAAVHPPSEDGGAKVLSCNL